MRCEETGKYVMMHITQCVEELQYGYSEKNNRTS